VSKKTYEAQLVTDSDYDSQCAAILAPEQKCL